MFSLVQEKILTGLINAQELAYSQARPKDERISNDLFNYHLQFLVKKGFVEKKGNLYRLTDRGKKATQIFDAKGNLKDLFKVSILAYVVRDNNGKKEILLQQRTRHPYLGDIEVVSGKVNSGEPIELAAKRKLKEETGLIAGFKLIGVYRTTRRDSKKEIIEDPLFHVCFAKNPQGQLLPQTDFGKNFWGTFGQAIKYQKDNIAASPCLEKIYKRVQRENFDFFYFQDQTVLTKF
ncbi:NUDIX domain-containing protein [Patescibacteria group bacterium]|nr:NUDIX domain-containing protein [Patescibacteria group bacterium]